MSILEIVPLAWRPYIWEQRHPQPTEHSMSKVYALIQFNLTNQAQFVQYAKGAFPTITAHGGRLLATSENQVPVEGTLPTSRSTLIEFPSKEAATAWYGSPEYQAVTHLRHEATDGGSFVWLDEAKLPTFAQK
jgi:uncharacterized protein (DUF1330 family)